MPPVSSFHPEYRQANASARSRPPYRVPPALAAVLPVLLAVAVCGAADSPYPRFETTPASPTTDDSIEVWLVMGRAESSCPPLYDDSCAVILDSLWGYPQTGSITLHADATPPPRDTVCENPVEYGPRCVLPPLPYGRYLVHGAWEGQSWELRVRHPGAGVTIGGTVRIAESGAPAVGATVKIDKSVDGAPISGWTRVDSVPADPVFELRNVPEGIYRLVARDSAGGTDTVRYAATHDIAVDLLTGEQVVAFDSTEVLSDGAPWTIRGYRRGIEYGMTVSGGAYESSDCADTWSRPLTVHYWVTSHTDSAFVLAFERTCRDVRCDDRSQAVVSVSTSAGVRLALDERVECSMHPRSYNLLRGDSLNEYRSVSVWCAPDTVRVRAWLYGYRASSALELIAPATDPARQRRLAPSRVPGCRRVTVDNDAVYLFLHEPDRVSVTIYTLDGRIAACLLDREPLGMGRHRIRLPLSVRTTGVRVVAVGFDRGGAIAMPVLR